MITPKLNSTVVKHRYDYNCVKMKHPELGSRQEPFAQRLADYMNKYTITVKRFAELSEEYAGKHGTKVTEKDINGYLYQGKSPKIDKLYAICTVMDVPLEYFVGYGPKNGRAGRRRRRW